MPDGSDAGTGSTDGTELDRRSVLRAASVATAGVAGLTGTAAAGAAATETRSIDEADASFFGACERGWETAPKDYPVLDLRTGTPFVRGDFPWGADEFLLYVHGWLETFARTGRNQGYTLETALERNGYEAPTVAVVWNSNQPAWPLAQQKADAAGRRLAAFLEEYLVECPQTTIKTVDHSLGSRVLLEATTELDEDSAGDDDHVFDNVSLIGGAVDPDTVCEGAQYGAGIERSAEEVYNYHSRDDDVVCETYALAEGTPGIGCVGSACGEEAPANVTDVDVTDPVDSHCDYGKPEIGCVPEIVANF